MHTWQTDRTVFAGNADLSGDLVVTDRRTGTQATVPAIDVLWLAANFVRRSRIADLEQMEGDNRAAIDRLDAMTDHQVLGVADAYWPVDDGR